jgi:uncharacterized protein
MKLNPEELQYFRSCIEPLLENKQVRQMETFVQHGSTSCLKHSIAVAYYSYVISRRLHIRCRAHDLICGALLHDFFLYDWHIPDKSHRLHGFRHPKTALENAEKYFTLNKTERDIISKHMFPLTFRFPRCRESLLVSLVDKGCSVAEMLEPCPGYRFYTKLPAFESRN